MLYYLFYKYLINIKNEKEYYINVITIYQLNFKNKIKLNLYKYFNFYLL